MKKYQNKEYLRKELRNKNYVQIAVENGVDTSTVQRWLKKYNFTNKQRKWSDSEIKILEENYETNPHAYKLLKNRTKSSIYHKACKLKLEKIIRERIYNLNHRFFKKQSQEMTYILGFFFSDGYVSSNKKSCGIHLNKKDYLILKKISKIMNSDRPIQTYKDSSYLRYDSKILVKDLISLGCIPRKSKKLQFPNNIKTRFLSHFIRGFFDGDGSIHFNKPNTIKISFVGTKKFLKELRLILNQQLNIKNNKIVQMKNIYRLYYYGNDARKLCKWMYNNSKSLYLQRKKERYTKHMEIRNGKI